MSIEPRQLDFLSCLTSVQAAPADAAARAKSARQQRGTRAYHSGLAAEDTVPRTYRAKGARLLKQRYRVREGEIDLIFEMDGGIVFCEVKSRRTIEEAAHSISARQWQRLEQASNRYMMEHDVGAATDLRFDAVLMDRTGAMEIVENAHLF